jgi:bacteriocin-like protein
MKTQEKKLEKLSKKQLNKVVGGDGAPIDRDKKKKLRNGNN